MKIRIEMEVGPQELREFLGLPDVSHLQQEALEAVAKRVRTGAASGADAMALLKSFVPEGLFSIGEWQRLALKALQTGEGMHVETTVEPSRPSASRKKTPAKKKRGPARRAS
jgi:hypothetical protein